MRRTTGGTIAGRVIAGRVITGRVITGRVITGRTATDAWRAEPLALVAQERGRLTLAAVDAAAEAGGLSPGQPLADARALLPALKTLPHDPQGDGAALERLADWCGRYSPWTAPCSSREGSGFAFGGAGGLLLDVTGCCHLLLRQSRAGEAGGDTSGDTGGDTGGDAGKRQGKGDSESEGEAALLGDLLARLAAVGFEARAGLADSPGAAWALARFATTSAQPWIRVAAGQTWQAIAPLPPAALRLPEVTVELVARFGLTRLSDLARLPRAALAPRFGALVARRLDQVQGREAEPISPRRPVPQQLARRLFAEPIASAGIDAAVTQALAELMRELCRHLEDQGLGARRLELTCYRVDASLQRLAVGTSRPSREERHLLRLFDNRLEGLDPGFGFEAMTLSAPIVEPLGARQFGLPAARAADRSQVASWAEPAPVPHSTSRPDRHAVEAAPRGRDPREVAPREADAESLAALVDRLGARLGLERVRRPLPRASHIPERAQRLLPVALAEKVAPNNKKNTNRKRSPKKNAKKKNASGEADGGLLAGAMVWRRGPARPLRLLPRPEPVEAVALLPDHPPARFRWRRLLHEVVRAEGPERLSPEWWVPRPDGDEECARDYFRVEDRDGRRYWLYRSDNRWFLHGLFA